MLWKIRELPPPIIAASNACSSDRFIRRRTWQVGAFLFAAAHLPLLSAAPGFQGRVVARIMCAWWVVVVGVGLYLLQLMRGCNAPHHVQAPWNPVALPCPTLGSKTKQALLLEAIPSA